MAFQITSPRLFAQPLIQAQIGENIKAPRHWPLWGEFNGDRPATRKMFPFDDVIMPQLLDVGSSVQNIFIDEISALGICMFQMYSYIAPKVIVKRTLIAGVSQRRATPPTQGFLRLTTLQPSNFRGTWLDGSFAYDGYDAFAKSQRFFRASI